MLAACSSARAAVRYVNAAATGTNDGSSWTNAWVDLQSALTAAASSDEIWVAAGTYKPTATTTRTFSFVLKNGVGVYGGFLGTETTRSERNPAAHVTILSGDIGTPGNSTDNSYHVVTADASVTASGVLDGFTITGGNASAGSAPDDRGAGLLASGGSPTIAHSVFTGNAASSRGGGTRLDGGSAVFLDCAFISNSAGLAGGGVSAGTVTSLTLTRCLVRANTAFDGTRGGGIDVTNGVTITDCLIAQNANNGVVFFQGENAIRDSTVTGHGGYGVSALSGSSAIVNSILWADATGETFFTGSAFLDISYSDVQGGASGAGNINANPLFVNAGGGDWRLGSGSPAVDAGNNAAVAAGITTDLGGRPRFFDDPAKADTGSGIAPIVDMGAYERVPLSVGAPAPASQSVCAGTAVSFSVTASGYQPAYRWRRDGGNLSDGGAISGAATPMLTIDPTATGDAGSFDVVVTDPFGQSATSSAATLTVKPSPSAVVTAPAAVCANRTPYAASVPSAGAGATYAWTIGNGAITAGAGTSAITFAAGASGSVQLSVTVTAGNGCAAQSSPLIPIVACPAEPRSLLVDPVPDGALSDGNGILEPGETAAVRPVWKNAGGSPLDLTGAASNLTGPAGAAYAVNDAAAGYGSIAAGATADCGTATGDCYEMTVSNPLTRPATHWDAAFTETLSDGEPPTVWQLHIGTSFTDVPKNHTFYSFVERILHNGVTTGCSATTYCPDDTVFRLQMAVFIARAQAGRDANIPVSGSAQGNPYNCVGGGQSQFTDIDPTNPFCRHVHYLFSTGVTTGCVTTPPRQYCPADNVSRGQMALFIARAVAGSDAAVPLTYGPDPVTGRSYSCNAGGPNLHFTDIATNDIFCRHTHYLWARDVISGFPDGSFGPGLFVTRGAMAKFLANGFNLQLYKP